MNKEDVKLKKTLFRVKASFLSLIFLIILLDFLLVSSFKTNTFYLAFLFSLSSFFILIFCYFLFKPEKFIEKRKEIFLLLVIILVFFIFFEIILNITSCERKYTFSPEESVKHKHEPNSLNCNSILDGERFYRKANSLGFIDDEFEFEEGDFNIFLVGDSFAQCLQANEEDCVYKKLEGDLRENYGEKINVFNFGIGWYGGLQETAIIKEYSSEYEPDMIIMYFLAQNDLVDNINYLNNYSQNKSARDFVRKLTPKSFIFMAIKAKNIFQKIKGVEPDSEAYNSQGIRNYEVYLKDSPKEWQEMTDIQLNAIKEASDFSKENNITFLLVGVTSPEQVYEWHWERILEDYPFMKDEEYDLNKPTDIVMNYASENSILHLNLIPEFKESPNNLHWEKDGHWNSEGQKFASELIKKYIDENGLITLG